ncbi:MAG TPA: large conductance mechanosensitive channel protein MscL [Dehalococcoidia bacterium]|nr:large conductance mechanosensitive channel protein MscL [Dehalococcoidia bacterium]
MIQDWWRDFKVFALQGNALDLAIGIILGIAFKAVIDSLVGDVLMNLIGAIFGKPNFDNLLFHVGQGEINYGKTITATVNFLIIAIVLLAVVKLLARLHIAQLRAQGTRECPYCRSFIPVDASRCLYCTSTVEPTLVEAE